MAEERIERRLAAILAADVAGYSRLMGEDEAGALAARKDRRAQVVDPRIAALGRGEDARLAAGEVRKLKPAFKLEDYAKSQPYKDPDHLNRLLGQLRAAGLD